MEYIYLLKNLKWYKCACMIPSYLFPSGKYMQMMTVLKPIAFDVILCMSQLFDYYFYTVSWNYIFMYWYILVKAECFIFFFLVVSIFFIWFQVYSFFGADTVSMKHKIYDTYTHKWIVDNFFISIKWKSPSKYHNIW